MKELIDAIAAKQGFGKIEVNPPASAFQIALLERQVGFSLPEDFKTFYALCNGFSCEEDMFNMLRLSDIPQVLASFGPNWFYFAEYMICCDAWGMRSTGNGQYEKYDASYPEITITTSLHEFLERFLQGNVFHEGGLYFWGEEIRKAIKQHQSAAPPALRHGGI